MRERSGACGKATKGVAGGEETSMSSIGKGTGVQQYAEYAPKRHSIRRERLEDKMGGSDCYKKVTTKQ